MANTILLKGEATVRKEQVATGVIQPGMQVSLAGAAGGGKRKAFAVENDLIGKGIDDNYAIGEVVQVLVCPTGTEINALLANGENVPTVGTPLVGAGNGLLAVAGSGEDGEIVAYALQVLNNASGQPARLRVEVA